MFLCYMYTLAKCIRLFTKYNIIKSDSRNTRHRQKNLSQLKIKHKAAVKLITYMYVDKFVKMKAR